MQTKGETLCNTMRNQIVKIARFYQNLAIFTIFVLKKIN